jgi:hypothetical protein
MVGLRVARGVGREQAHVKGPHGPLVQAELVLAPAHMLQGGLEVVGQDKGALDHLADGDADLVGGEVHLELDAPGLCAGPPPDREQIVGEPGGDEQAVEGGP